jgi:hypothetical protein
MWSACTIVVQDFRIFLQNSDDFDGFAKPLFAVRQSPTLPLGKARHCHSAKNNVAEQIEN